MIGAFVVGEFIILLALLVIVYFLDKMFGDFLSDSILAVKELLRGKVRISEVQANEEDTDTHNMPS